MLRLCQSCGMPMSDKGLAPGREIGGSISPYYCHLCYDEGVFLQPEIRLSSMQHLVIHALQRNGWPKMVAWVATRHLPFLRRWR
ncbi:zinc ribbon domain-containing protein [Aliiroseovarius salicola]|uniref:zinc ribbon domain-containing protein n=1 Tax=Aliiroseovarius salicola TaxID=3009082 RepID=UPI0038CBF46F